MMRGALIRETLNTLNTHPGLQAVGLAILLGEFLPKEELAGVAPISTSQSN